MHCFNVFNEVPKCKSMRIETVENDLYDSVELECNEISKMKADEKEDNDSKLQLLLDIKSISGLYRYLIQYASLTLEKLKPIVFARTALDNLDLRKESYEIESR
ncbi:MAG: hypothetical protein EXX96DRAFT_540468 [Benjaminiella poitrasii]|nr:MAG: hypothetical protein EXX96DRAFT_540468 [Benjaminiella poitrasii]